MWLGLVGGGGADEVVDEILDFFVIGFGGGIAEVHAALDDGVEIEGNEGVVGVKSDGGRQQRAFATCCAFNEDQAREGVVEVER